MPPKKKSKIREHNLPRIEETHVIDIYSTLTIEV